LPARRNLFRFSLPVRTVLGSPARTSLQTFPTLSLIWDFMVGGTQICWRRLTKDTHGFFYMETRGHRDIEEWKPKRTLLGFSLPTNFPFTRPYPARKPARPIQFVLSYNFQCRVRHYSPGDEMEPLSTLSTAKPSQIP